LVFAIPPGYGIREADLLRVISEFERTKISGKPLEILLNSTGGNVYSAYKIVQVIRSETNAVTIVVPLMAKSAATLMALSADTIVMGPQSELGPLDLPVEHPTAAVSISSLDAVQAVEYFASVVSSQARLLTEQIRDEIGGVTQKDAIEMALHTTVAYLTPIVQQLDPQIVHNSYRELQIAGRYAKELLQAYMFKDDPAARRRAEEIAEKLVWDYPSHGFAISRGAAKDLGLSIKESKDYDRWGKLWKAYLMFRRFNQKVIKVYTHAEIDKFVED